MLPDAEDSSAFGAKATADATVASPVSLDLGFPECRPSPRPGRVLGTTMPEAAVYKHRGLQLRENEVRFARQLGATPPDRDRVRLENLNQT